jgi:glycosyltransferase involved in cell wall biosynthesis
MAPAGIKKGQFVMPPKDSVTVVVPARDEENHLERAVEEMLPAIERHWETYEVLVFNDGSSDATGEIADRLAARHEHIRAIHNPVSLNLGGVIRKGVTMARMPYAIYIDGKGATSAEALDAIFGKRGQADLVIPYATNMHVRSMSRRIISWVFRNMLNALFGLRVRHFGNSILFRTEQLRRFHIRTNSFGFQPEALIKMIRAGHTYVHVGFEDRFDFDGRKTKAFKWKNIRGTCGFVLRTLWDVYVLREHLRPTTSRARAVPS